MRQLAEVRKKQLLEISIELSKEIGYKKITRELIAKHAKVSVSLVTYHFKTMMRLKELVLQLAIQHDIGSIIAQAIIQNDPIVKRLSIEYKRKILKGFIHAIQ